MRMPAYATVIKGDLVTTRSNINTLGNLFCETDIEPRDYHELVDRVLTFHLAVVGSNPTSGVEVFHTV